MKKTIITFVALLVGLMTAAQSFSAGDVYLKAGETGNMCIMLSQSFTGIAAGFYVELPEGFSIDGEPTMIYGSHLVKVSHAGNNKERVIVYSPSNANFHFFEFPSSMFLSLPIKAGNKAGRFKGKFTNIEFATSAGQFNCLDDLSFDIIVSNMLGNLSGDINLDGTVDIADINIVINIMLGKDQASNYGGHAYVTQGDNDIDIADVNAVINYMLGKNTSLPSMPDGYEIITANGVSFKMIGVEGGMFIMGDLVDNKDNRTYAYPAHPVTLFDFAIADTEVTQQLWRAVMGRNPSGFPGDLQRPVENVSWDDCLEFISKLNNLTGKHFRLPTEAEWEYAARGGKMSQGYTYSGSNVLDLVGWYVENSSETTHPVGQKMSNELGLFDMSGNVDEWCSDSYDEYDSAPQTNPNIGTRGSHSIRGGSWTDDVNDSRVIHRGGTSSTARAKYRGMRLALDL